MKRNPIAILLAAALPCAAGAPVPGLNKFSSDLYRRLAQPGEANLAFSPFSISTALSMALAGARGHTAAEMAKLLGQSEPSAAYHAELAALIDQIVKAANGNGSQLHTANRVWIQQDFDTAAAFRDLLRDTYHAPASPLDFAHAIEPARGEINSWTERETHGKIRDLFPAGSLDANTRLVLTSAVYFYGKWESPFRKTETRPEPFTLASGKTAQADFMHQTARFGYAETAAGQLLEMRYAGTGLAFDILLPKKGAALDTVAADLPPDRLAAWLGALANRSVQVAVPKFRVESKFSLAAVLKTLGLSTAFGDAADFSGIDGRRDLHLSTVVHKAFVDVAEEGTEAAAATGLGVALVSMVQKPEPVFRADHPFLFLIRDTRTGLILFTGRVMNPKS